MAAGSRRVRRIRCRPPCTCRRGGGERRGANAETKSAAADLAAQARHFGWGCHQFGRILELAELIRGARPALAWTKRVVAWPVRPPLTCRDVPTNGAA